jgi:hypothetical protein
MPSDEEVTQRAGSLRTMTGLTPPACSARLPPFEHAFLGDMEDRTLDGQPRTSRRARTYGTCPLATTADTRLFILTYVQQHPIQEVPGQLFGMSQAHAKQWIHLLPAVWNHALAHPELLPACHAAELATRLATARTADVPPPLFGMMVPSARSTARSIQRHNRTTTAARRKATRAKTSWSSMRPVTSASYVLPMRAQCLTKAWQSWPAIPFRVGVISLKRGDARALGARG